MSQLVQNKTSGDGRDNRPPRLSLRRQQNFWAGRTFFVFSVFPIALALIIFVMLVVRTWPLFESQSIWELLTSSVWKPDEKLFGFWPFIAGTFWVTSVAIILAVPPCLMTSLYLSEYASASTRMVMKPLLDLLAAIPSVVYGVWGVLAIVPLVGDTIAPFFRHYLGFIPFFAGKNPTGFSILSGSVVLAVMIAPFIIAVTYEVMSTVPQGLRQASLALGTTRWQTIRYAVLPQVLPGIMAGIVLGASRALGETMAVIMVVGNVVQTPHSIFDTAYPLPALIANNYGEMMSIPLYDSALLGAALILLVMILIFNIGSTLILRRVIGRNWV